jgi:hypothetical protein
MQDRKAEKSATETIRDLGENAREAAGRAQEAGSRAAEAFREYQLKLVSVAQANTNAVFEYAHDLLHAQSISDAIEISTSHSRRQLEMMAEQARELTSTAQKVAADTTGPFASTFGRQGAQMS